MSSSKIFLSALKSGYTLHTRNLATSFQYSTFSPFNLVTKPKHSRTLFLTSHGNLASQKISTSRYNKVLHSVQFSEFIKRPLKIKNNHRLQSASSSINSEHKSQLVDQNNSNMKVSISSAFDGGNIEFVESSKQSETEQTVLLKIKPDP